MLTAILTVTDTRILTVGDARALAESTIEPVTDRRERE
jgi:hypothetical protein